MAQGYSAYPENVWEKKILEEHAWWDRFGCGIDARNILPKKDYQAHMALIEGENKQKKADAKKQERKMKRK